MMYFAIFCFLSPKSYLKFCDLLSKLKLTYLKALRSSCFRGGCRKNFFTGKVWGLCEEHFGTFLNEANRSKIDKQFLQSYLSACGLMRLLARRDLSKVSNLSAYQQKKSIKILRSPIGKLCNLSLQRKTNPTGFLPWYATGIPRNKTPIKTK